MNGFENESKISNSIDLSSQFILKFYSIKTYDYVLKIFLVWCEPNSGLNCCQTGSCDTPGEIGYHYIVSSNMLKLLPDNSSLSPSSQPSENAYHTNAQIAKQIAMILLTTFLI
jgi:hypothetical protein